MKFSHLSSPSPSRASSYLPHDSQWLGNVNPLFVAKWTLKLKSLLQKVTYFLCIPLLFQRSASQWTTHQMLQQSPFCESSNWGWIRYLWPHTGKKDTKNNHELHLEWVPFWTGVSIVVITGSLVEYHNVWHDHTYSVLVVDGGGKLYSQSFMWAGAVCLSLQMFLFLEDRVPPPFSSTTSSALDVSGTTLQAYNAFSRTMPAFLIEPVILLMKQCWHFISDLPYLEWDNSGCINTSPKEAQVVTHVCFTHFLCLLGWLVTFLSKSDGVVERSWLFLDGKHTMVSDAWTE